MDNIRLDALKQGKLRWGHETDLINNAGLSDPGTSLDFSLYREELSSNNIMTLKLDVTIWGSNLSSISRFRLLPDSAKATDSLTVPHPVRSTFTGSASTLRMAYKWFRSCHAHHGRCGGVESLSPKPAWRPSRLLDVGHHKEEKIKLVLSRHDAIDPHARYITLSYRWGSETQKLMLKSANLDAFRQGTRIHDLPQTFQDLVAVTRAFGIRYVWIDALCIIQDSTEDWEREGAMMRDVYANSACTIAATASESPDQGLFRHRKPAAVLPGRIRAPSAAGPPPDGGKNTDYFLFDRSFLERRLFNGPLHMRGWVFQERMLSPRVLHFTKDQMVWECFTETKCETFPRGMPLGILTKEPFARSQTFQGSGSLHNNGEASDSMDWKTLSAWRELVKQYSKCDLTYTSDKLPAFAGLAKAYQEMTGDVYLAGLWKSHLLHQLDWRVYTPKDRVSLQYRAPSWSWASVDSPVRPFTLDPRSRFLPVLRDVQVATKGPSYFGRVSTAHLDLEGFLILASVCGLDDDDGTACELQVEGHVVSGQLWRDGGNTRITSGSAVKCLPLKVDIAASGTDELVQELTLVCMMLKEIHGTTAPVAYRRVGLLVVPGEDRQLKPFELFGIRVTEETNLKVTKEYCIIRIV